MPFPASRHSLHRVVVRRALTVFAASVALVTTLAPLAHADKQFNFSYTFPLAAGGTVGASGVLTTTDFDTMLGAYTITGITGTRTYNGVTDNITGLIAPGGFGGNDNLLFATQPFLDGNGFSYTINVINGNRVNVFYDGGANYTEHDGRVNDGPFTVTPVIAAAVPEPGVVAFGMIAAGGVLGLVARKRKK